MRNGGAALDTMTLPLFVPRVSLDDIRARLSPRLKALLDVLEERPLGASTLVLAERSGSLATHSGIAELRTKIAPAGYTISCSRTRQTDSGRSVFTYRLEAVS